jgi:hypothetical protein
LREHDDSEIKSAESGGQDEQDVDNFKQAASRKTADAHGINLGLVESELVSRCCLALRIEGVM